MRIKFKKSTSSKVIGRLKKKGRIRNKISGTSERPRLSVYRSTNHIYAQVIDDVAQKTIASASSLKVSEKLSGVEMAKKVGEMIAASAKEKNVESVVFDRNGFIFHGKIKAVADAAREAGLKF
jgi:large subunit ribosomal protein L18